MWEDRASCGCAPFLGLGPKLCKRGDRELSRRMHAFILALLLAVEALAVVLASSSSRGVVLGKLLTVSGLPPQKEASTNENGHGRD